MFSPLSATLPSSREKKSDIVLSLFSPPFFFPLPVLPDKFKAESLVRKAPEEGRPSLAEMSYEGRGRDSPCKKVYMIHVKIVGLRHLNKKSGIAEISFFSQISCDHLSFPLPPGCRAFFRTETHLLLHQLTETACMTVEEKNQILYDLQACYKRRESLESLEQEELSVPSNSKIYR